ncbi:MAG: hypothetical protein U0031_12560 [Thermomicrobiales bacterium]
MTSAQIAHYRAAARLWRETEQRALAAREQRAWDTARQAARELRAVYDVERVVVFGSLARPGHFTLWSDIDIAAWGLKPEATFRAIGTAMDCSAEFAVNLVDVTMCPSALLESIEREGVDV